MPKGRSRDGTRKAPPSKGSDHGGHTADGKGGIFDHRQNAKAQQETADQNAKAFFLFHRAVGFSLCLFHGSAIGFHKSILPISTLLHHVGGYVSHSRGKQNEQKIYAYN